MADQDIVRAWAYFAMLVDLKMRMKDTRTGTVREMTGRDMGANQLLPDPVPYSTDMTAAGTAGIRPFNARLPRLQLLGKLVQEIRDDMSKETGGDATHFDIIHNREFQILEFKGAVSGPKVQCLGGAWIRIMWGEVMLRYVPDESMTAADWEEYAAKGSEWDHRGKEKSMRLVTGGIFTFPPGSRMIYSTEALKTTLMVGEMTWDSKLILQHLDIAYWIAANPKVTDQSYQSEFYHTGQKLKEVVNKNPAEYCGDMSVVDFQSQFNEKIDKFKDLACDCQPCGYGCKCLKAGRPCTRMCGQHDDSEACCDDPKA